MQTSIILFAITQNTFYQQSLFLINSIIKKNSNVRINVFTDNMQWIPTQIQEKIEVLILNMPEIKLLKGKYKFIHNIKIALIEKIANEQGGNIIYIDSDCFLIKDLQDVVEKIRDGFFVMHKRENKLSTLEEELSTIATGFNNPTYDYKKIVEEYNLDRYNYYMWNAGVIGGSSTALLSNIKDVYKLTEFIYHISKSHVSEQLAFSIVFQKFGKIYSAEDYIYHYWPSDEKLFMQSFITSYLNSIKNGSERLNFSELPSIISNSYFVCKSRALDNLECNSFNKGYIFSLRAFLANPLLDKEFANSLRFHIIRHLKHLAKVALGKV